MEDVLDLYAQPYDPRRPVVGLARRRPSSNARSAAASLASPSDNIGRNRVSSQSADSRWHEVREEKSNRATKRSITAENTAARAVSIPVICFPPRAPGQESTPRNSRPNSEPRGGQAVTYVNVAGYLSLLTNFTVVHCRLLVQSSPRKLVED